MSATSASGSALVMMPASHQGRVAIVTGAARGIGQAIARVLASRGATLVLVDLIEPKETANLIGEECLSLTADVSRDLEWARVVQAVDTRFGRADIVVNNAGIYPLASIEELSDETWRRTFAVNLDAHLFSARHCLPLMRRHGWGRFVNISSNSIGVSATGLSHYMASKMGVIGFVRGLANDVAPHGITVNALLPALTSTPGMAVAPREMIDPVVQAQAIKRFAQPEDIAGPVAFLTSDDAAFVTGQALVVDGGLYKIS